MKRKAYVILLAILFLALIPLKAEKKAVDKQKDEVMKVLQKFQDGYTARDVSKLDEYMNELFDSEDTIMVGTSGYSPGRGEWFEGFGEAKKLVEHDWKNWDDLRLNLDKARIRVEGNTAWVLVIGVSESRKVKEEQHAGIIDRIARTIELNKKAGGEGVNRELLFWMLKYISDHLEEYEVGGDECIYPLRITAVLVKKKGKWQFRFMEFTFPLSGTTIPDVRITREEKEKLTAI